MAKLQKIECPHCGAKFFPVKDSCPKCHIRHGVSVITTDLVKAKIALATNRFLAQEAAKCD